MGYSGSHVVEEKGSKVVIRDLELFCEFDPSLDDGSDPDMAKFDEARVRRIAEKTAKHIEAGSLPQIVRRHDGQGKDVPPVADGSVVGVRFAAPRGVPHILGDVEMSRSKFEEFIASNEYPRRSAEIWGNDHMSEVALLGRETPRRPLRDTRFQRHGDRLVFEMPGGETQFELSREPYTPTFGGKKRKKKGSDMADQNDGKADRCDRLERENAKLKAQLETIENRSKETFEKFSKELMERETSEKALMAKTIESLTGQIKTLNEKAVAAECDVEITNLEKDGYAFGADVRAKLVAQLAKASDRGELVSLWRQTFRKVATSPVLGGVRNLAPESEKGPLTAEDVVRFQKESGGDPAKFRELMNRATNR